MSTEGCMTVRTHDMRYIGQGYWRCVNCGHETPVDNETVDHTHTMTSEELKQRMRQDLLDAYQQEPS